MVQEDMPSVMADSVTWLKPSTGEQFRVVDGEWVVLPVVAHSHPTHSDINFTGTVSADDNLGLTGERTLGGYKITFKKGLLVGFGASIKEATMPNPKMDALTKDSSDAQIQEAISAEIETCMGEPGAEQRACAGRAYGIAREKTGKELNYGR